MVEFGPSSERHTWVSSGVSSTCTIHHARHPPTAEPAAQQFQDDVGIVVIVLDLDTSVRGIEVHGGDPVLTAGVDPGSR